MRIPFDISKRPQIESGEYKVETRDGKKVRVLCYDANNIVPVVALVTFNDGSEGSRDYYLDGRMDFDRENPLDLFIVTPEPEMSEWQTFISGCLQKHGLLDCGAADRIAKESAAELLSLAKQQLLQSGELMTQEHHEKLMETLREECKKDLPRWRIWRNGAWNSEGYPIALVHRGCGFNLVSVLGVDGEKYIMLSDIKKLPGFKEED